MVELQGRVTAVESSVRDMQGWQQVEWKAEFAAMVDKQLAQMEQRFSGKIENWTTSTIQTCQAAIEQMDGLRDQLQDIKEQQRELSKAQEDICERLEALGCPGLPPIAEEGAASPVWHISDSAKSEPQSSVSRG